MSTLLSTQNLSFHNNHGLLLNNISLALTKGEKIGLIGYNGCGKSTLLKLLSNQLSPSEGTISIANKTVMAYIEQHLPYELNSITLMDAVLHKLPEDYRLSEAWRADLLLSEMGFKEYEKTLLISQLSGGQHTRLLLARALILEPDLLLLDEPSNHLDLPTILWLESFLKNWRGSFILVSHDNTLLDHVTNCTWIIRDKTLSLFRLPCSEARKAQEEQDISAQHRHEAQQNEIDRIAQSAKQLATWGHVYDNENLSRKAKQMEKQIIRLKDDQVEVAQGSQWILQLSGISLRADRLCELNQLSVIPANNAPTLYKVEQQRIKSGDRVAIIGANGTGKSSLLRMIWSMKSIETNGDSPIRLHPRVELGYYDQRMAQLIDSDTIIDALKPFAPLTDEQRKMALISAGFVYSRHNQIISSLSGGERARLLFIGLSLAKYSLLMLDEPTNHLDMDGKQALAEQISQFSGGILLVSHDRELIENSCNRFWYIHNGILTEHHDIDTIYQLITQEETTENSMIDIVDIKQENQFISAHCDEDEKLMQLIELEAKLNADRARKANHQKPTLQAQWECEIKQLKHFLNLI